MAVRQSAPYPVVHVVWLDSTQPIGTWRWVEDIEGPTPVRCETVGFLIHDDLHAVSIALSIGRVGEDGPLQASGVVEIPRAAILEANMISA